MQVQSISEKLEHKWTSLIPSQIWNNGDTPSEHSRSAYVNSQIALQMIFKLKNESLMLINEIFLNVGIYNYLN